MTSHRDARARTVAGVAFVLAGATTIQWSAAIVTPVLGAIGPSAATAWRYLVGAVVLVALTRPRVRHWSRSQWLGAAALGVSTAVMSFCFYQSIARITLGSAVAIEYLGPFLVAALGRRTARHLVLVAVAGAGVLALARPGGGVTLVGGLFALGSGAGWAGYAFASRRVGHTTDGFQGLAVAMAIAAVLASPFAVASFTRLFSHAAMTGRMALVAVMSIVVGFALEMQALRRIRPSVVSVVIALDPAVAFVVGWLLLGQTISTWDIVGLICVVVAGVGVTYDVAKAGEALDLTGVGA